jgi:dihydropyrimidine dehydrogenase (NAD+) subunit PreA
MPSLETNCGGIKSPNLFWPQARRRRTPPAVVQRLRRRLGAAHVKTLGQPIQNVSSRFGATNVRGVSGAGFNNIRAHH